MICQYKVFSDILEVPKGKDKGKERDEKIK
jgi:hypothetical protein